MLKLVQTQWGQFDLALNLDNPTQGNLETLIYAAIFTDARDPNSNTLNCGGWWFKPVGNKIWLLRRNGLSPAIKSATIAEIKRSLTNIGLKNVSVTEVVGGNTSRLTVEIECTHNGEKSIMRANL